MLDSVLDMLLVNAYWFSLPFIGYMCLVFLDKARHPFEHSRYIARRVRQQHLFIIMFASFAGVAGLFAAISLPLYILNAPTLVLTAIYIGLLTGSLAYGLYWLSKNIFTKRIFNLFKLSGQPLLVRLVFWLLALLLIFDFALSLYVKSYASGDTLYHLARITAIINDGFTIASGHFSQLADTAYHYNFLYGLYAVATNILDMAPVEVYKTSLGFFRMAQWLAVFTLMWYVARFWLKNKNALLLSSLATIFTMCFLSGALFVATYPNKIINLWVVLFIICLSLYESGTKKMIVPLLVSSLLITMTHASAAMVVLFMGLYVLYWIGSQGVVAALRDKGRVLAYACIIGILSIGPLITLAIPGHLTEDQMHLGDFPVLHVAGMTMRDPVAEWLSKSTVEQALLLIGIVGTVYLLMRIWKNVRQRQIILALSTFYIFIMYIPPVFSIVNQFLPMWAMNRFSSMNILGLILIPISIYAIANMVIVSSKMMKQRFSIETRRKYRDGLLIIVVLLLSLLVAVPGYTKLVADRQKKSDTFSQLVHANRDLGRILYGNKVILASLGTSYNLTAVLDIDVVAVPLGHSTSSADTMNRLACHRYMMEGLGYDELASAGVSFVVFTKKSDSVVTKQLADSKEYLKIVAENRDYIVYALKKTAANPNHAYAPCTLYQKNEQGNR